jgi:hypothetical protein
MALYLRLLGTDPVNPKIPIHQFQALAAEWARGRITGAQANAGITQVSGAPLTAAEQTEAQALVNTVPVGTTTAIQAARAQRMLEIDQVFLLVDSRIAPYDNEAAIKARLGV